MTLTRTQVHPSELMAALAAGTAPRVLDVRTPAEFETVHIPGSYNVPLDNLREHREELRTTLEDALSAQTAAHWRDVLQAERLAGVHADPGPVVEEVGVPDEDAGAAVRRPADVHGRARGALGVQEHVEP